VAEDLAAGRAALDRLGQGPRPTVVTLEGEIIRPGGAVTGGQEGNRGDDALLARERELRELPDELTQAQQQAQRCAADAQGVAAQIEQKRVAAEGQQRQLAEQARQEHALRQQVEEARRTVDRARQAQRWHGERVTQVSTEADGLAERRERLTGEVAGADGAAQAALAALAQVEAELAAVSGDELMQELANRRSAAAEVQGHLRSQQALLDNATRSLQAVTAQLADRERRIAALDSEIAELAGQVNSLVREEQGLSREIGAQQAVIQPLEAELTNAEAAQVEQETVERALQQHLRREESALSAAQLQLQRSEDGLHQLRGEIEQDLGLVELEQSDDLAYQPPLPWDAFVQQLPVLESIPDALDEEVREMRARLARLSGVNPDAPREYDEAASRHEFLTTQAHDLEAAAADLRKIIRELDMWMETELRRTVEAVGREFAHFFHQLFNGGTAHLELTDPEHIATSGIEIIARPPGKRPQSLALLSGGERSLAACALIFAILRVSPTPFCVLDEVDAALDEANVDRFRATLEDLSRETQFIVVTHNRRTLEGANTIYGVTMGNDGVSRVISLRLVGDRIVKHEEAVEEATEGSDGADELKVIEEEIQM
jgi:chromosome segregation protein